jgi:5-methylcytosine-specific restriction endonuclease McrA
VRSSKHPSLYPDRKPIPDEVRRAVTRRADGQCERCWRRAPLELHHTTYVWPASASYFPDTVEIFGRETPDELLALCRGCHLGEHVAGGEFYADPEEAESERDYRSHMMRPH